MLINLNVNEREILIAGGGSVGERMAQKFLSEGCRVVVGSINFAESLKRSSLNNSKLELVQLNAKEDSAILEKLVSTADIVIAATSDTTLNKDIVEKARSKGALVCVVDKPSESDFSPVAITNVGGIQIAVYTEGKSPAMAMMLRKRIAKTITPSDVLKVELLHYARGLAKNHIIGSKTREVLMYKIIEDEKINALLKTGSIEEAKRIVEKTVKACKT